MRIVIREKNVDYKPCDKPVVRTPADAARLATEIAESDTEVFGAHILDARNGLYCTEIVSNGILNASLVHAREVFRTAISKGAGAIVLLHCHPSGDLTPSAEDIRITKQLVEAGRIVDIKVCDHIILASAGRHLSLREEGLVSFS